MAVCSSKNGPPKVNCAIGAENKYLDKGIFEFYAYVMIKIIIMTETFL